MYIETAIVTGRHPQCASRSSPPLCLRVVRLRTRRARYRQRLLNLCGSGSDLEASIKACSQILAGKENAKNKLTALYNRGWAYNEKGKYDLAIADYTRAMELDPKSALPFHGRSISYYNKGDYELAIADATRAIEINPKEAKAFNNRGSAYMQKGEYERAIVDLTRAVALDPKLANAYRHRGVVYLKAGKLDLARADLTKALELKPDYQEAKTALADLEQAEVSAKATPSSHDATDKATPENKAASAAPLPKAPPSAFPSGKRVALVIGNSAYRSVNPLRNPGGADSKIVAEEFRKLGFAEVIEKRRISRSASYPSS